MPTNDCMPADFEKQSAILLGCNELFPYHPRVLVELCAALIDKIAVIGIVENEEQRKQVITLLCDWGLPAHLLHFVSLPVKGMWVRDYGPAFVRGRDGAVTILDAEYLETDRPEDDKAPSELAALLRLPVAPVPLICEGGNLLSNGQGLCVSTTSLAARNAHRGYSAQMVCDILGRYYGFRQVSLLKPLLSEPTGHVDMFATFVSPNVAVVGQYDPKIDPVNADILDENARILSQARTAFGPLRVVRIPMPSNRGGIWKTFTNVIYANGTLIMPTYGASELDAQKEAIATYSRLLPDWEVLGVDATSVIKQRGSLRCVSINIPWLEDVFPAPSEFKRPRLLQESVVAA
ncbi:MAG TPA: agmatine deiminase family protein [Tepidisphaeraceae bacterium]|jgi:agmatine/peptidylarginine deiminase|nr:agmatine deiminase family protein [Tepidisphaeraceae bacterium]